MPYKESVQFVTKYLRVRLRHATEDHTYFFMSGDNPGAATALTDQNRRKLAAKLRQTHATLQPTDRDGYCRYISEQLEAAAQDEAEKARKSRARTGARGVGQRKGGAASG